MSTVETEIRHCDTYNILLYYPSRGKNRGGLQGEGRRTRNIYSERIGVCERAKRVTEMKELKCCQFKNLLHVSHIEKYGSCWGATNVQWASDQKYAGSNTVKEYG